MRRFGTATKSTATGGWTTGARPTSSRWPAPNRRKGHEHWTLRLLAGKAVELGLVDSLSHETVRLRLKKRAQAAAEPAMVHPKGER